MYYGSSTVLPIILWLVILTYDVSTYDSYISRS